MPAKDNTRPALFPGAGLLFSVSRPIAGQDFRTISAVRNTEDHLATFISSASNNSFPSRSI